MSNCVICTAVTRVVNYLSNFLPLEYSLFYFSGPTFLFQSHWWIFWTFGNMGLRYFICNLPAWKWIWILYRGCYAAS